MKKDNGIGFHQRHTDLGKCHDLDLTKEIEITYKAQVQVASELFGRLSPQLKDMVLDALSGIDIVDQEYDPESGLITLHVEGRHLLSELYTVTVDSNAQTASLTPLPCP